MRSRRFIGALMTAAVIIPVAGGEAQQRPGALTGCVTDATGTPIPGVKVIASSRDWDGQAVTDAAGCYGVNGLGSGSYLVLACLQGFSTVARSLLVQERIQTLDFQIKPAPICECITYPSLPALWQAADAVVRVRLADNRRLGPDVFDGASLIHAATVVTVWKSDPMIGGPTIDVLQELGAQCQPYEIGRELVLFLKWRVEDNRFERVNRDNGAFTLEAGRVTSAGVNDYSGKKVADLLAELDALATK